MNKESNKIFKMLAEEVINTDQAIQLLKALNSNGVSEYGNNCEITWEKYYRLLEMVEEGDVSAKKAAKIISGGLGMNKESVKILKLLADEEISAHRAMQLLKSLNPIGVSKMSCDNKTTLENLCKFLKMIEEGKISANRAARFIQRLNAAAYLDDDDEDFILHTLAMIEDGDICANEAAELLITLEIFNNPHWNSDFKYIDEMIKQANENTERFAEDFSERFNAAFQEVEAELDSAAKEVVGAVATLLDNVSKSMKEKRH